ncbi:hypothetical protein CONCODRAFT_12868 [Conidiobolus coronatus NRRL 28638]|uniref:F-box domain-containing protein n=1 Tax=Conidiobolus coronatus (strain ATCC 28846 / CBS 209.66 / NRRL 28638) TaxID=796925 RepID=A0A137NRX9_CONC2|nr:hypothetical protein CONCODRAFT_12868 [Conidiobolus coronatus NRRL 28638]|eukprot:KXN65523.1 hypothetical protein CONCODRAFT_12868 [Conidiobolus coronatus NRRL 28638]
MSSDIDWTMVLIKTPITRYLGKFDALDLSLTNKRIRLKLYSKIFDDLIIDSKVLNSHSNYFDLKRCYQFRNLTWIKRFKLARKYGSNKDLAFKEVQIDPFIKEITSTLISASIHCKSLIFHNLTRASYFLFPVFDNFINLRKLYLCGCEIPNSNFINLLTKLDNLDILIMQCIYLTLTNYEDRSLARNIKLPISLKKLTYLSVRLEITDWYQMKPREVIRNITLGDDVEDLDIMPQIFPNLKYFEFYDNGQGTGKMEEFKVLNPNVQYVNNFLVL